MIKIMAEFLATAETQQVTHKPTMPAEGKNNLQQHVPGEALWLRPP